MPTSLKLHTGRPTAAPTGAPSVAVEANTTSPAASPEGQYAAPSVAPIAQGPPTPLTAQSLAAQLLSSFIAPVLPAMSPPRPTLPSVATPDSNSMRMSQTEAAQHSPAAACQCPVQPVNPTQCPSQGPGGRRLLGHRNAERWWHPSKVLRRVLGQGATEK